MAKAIFRVKYEEKWNGWVSESSNVLALSAEEAITKARAKALKETFEGEDGKMRKCSGFRLLSVALLAAADF